jgi:hypothetical protein
MIFIKNFVPSALYLTFKLPRLKISELETCEQNNFT